MFHAPHTSLCNNVSENPPKIQGTFITFSQKYLTSRSCCNVLPLFSSAYRFINFLLFEIKSRVLPLSFSSCISRLKIIFFSTIRLHLPLSLNYSSISVLSYPHQRISLVIWFPFKKETYVTERYCLYL